MALLLTWMEREFYPNGFLLQFKILSRILYVCRYSGTFFSDIPGGLTYSSTPRIATFHSDGSTVKQGFRIAFSSEPESQTTEAPLPPVQQLGKRLGLINVKYWLLSR